MVNLPTNTPININYTSAGALLTINSSSGNTITVNVLIVNDTSNTTSTPTLIGTTFSKLAVLDVNSSVTSNVVYGLTIRIPCGSNAAPYKLNATTGDWIAITPFSVNKAACTLSFNIPPDPVIGVFASSPTSTVSNSGGGVPSAGAGAAGPGGPTTTPISNGYEISNLTVPNTASVSVQGKSITLTVSSISPASAVVIVNGVSYNLQPNTPVQVDPPAFVYFVDLKSVSYTPSLHAITIEVYSQPNQTTTITPVNSTTNSTTPTTTVVPVVTTTVVPTPPTASAGTSTFSVVLFEMIGVLAAIAVAGAFWHSRLRSKRE